MKRVALAILVAGFTASLSAKAVTLTGTYVEARTAEVFAGACVMNGEAGTTGREALMAWKVDQGRFNGVSLDGLAVVAALAADANLGVQEIGGEVAKARTALVAMAKQLSRGLVDTVVEVTPTPIQFVDDGTAIRVTTKSVQLRVEKELTHDPTCGGRQWFHPLSAVDSAEMGTTAENAFTGTTLGTRWSDPNKRSGFFGKFSN